MMKIMLSVLIATVLFLQVTAESSVANEQGTNTVSHLPNNFASHTLLKNLLGSEFITRFI